jgi:hypothetical protein
VIATVHGKAGRAAGAIPIVGHPAAMIPAAMLMATWRRDRAQPFGV